MIAGIFSNMHTTKIQKKRSMFSHIQVLMVAFLNSYWHHSATSSTERNKQDYPTCRLKFLLCLVVLTNHQAKLSSSH